MAKWQKTFLNIGRIKILKSGIIETYLYSIKLNKKDLSVCVVGRGKSLEKINIINPDDIDISLIVNSFNKESENKDVYNFLNKTKNIFILSRSNESISNKSVYEKLNAEKCVFNVWKDEFLRKQSAIEKRRLLKPYGIKCEYMPDKMKEDALENGKKNYPTSGTLAILYAILALNANKISIIGIDCYEQPYFDGPKLRKVQTEKRPNKMKQYICNLTRKYYDIEYRIYSYADFSNIEFENNVELVSL